MGGGTEPSMLLGAASMVQPRKFGFALRRGCKDLTRSPSPCHSPSTSSQSIAGRQTSVVVQIADSSDSDGGAGHAQARRTKRDPDVKRELANTGTLTGNGGALTWSVIEAPPTLAVGLRGKQAHGNPNQKRRLSEHTDGAQRGSGMRVLKRFHAMRSKAASDESSKKEHLMDEQSLSVASAQLHDRAVSLISATLSGAEQATEIATMVVGSFVNVQGISGARRTLLALNAALRVNTSLKTTVLAASPSEIATLAHQDPREWASEEIQAMRRQWEKEALEEVKPAGPVGNCPECGGRAVVATGTAGSGRSARLTKAFAHYSCLEDNCGKSSHIKQD